MSGSHVFHRRLDRDLPCAVRAEGVWVYDGEGRKYLDASGGPICVNIGHGREEVAEAMARPVRNADYVHEKSGGRLGYVHIRAMSHEAYSKLLVDLDTETHSKEGVVVDVRYNGGGHIASFILDVLRKRSYVQSAYRGRTPTSSTNLAGNRILEKPTILVQNEHSGSNTEMFSEGFRRFGLGKVVGMPTAGAVIWTTNVGLLDGTWFRVPFVKVATLDGENLEGTARTVDIQVDRPLGEAAENKDSQLDAAVEHLLRQIDEA